MSGRLTDRDRDAVDAFRNFLSWGAAPMTPHGTVRLSRDVPPAWWAYVLGHTTWCPPAGEQ